MRLWLVAFCLVIPSSVLAQTQWEHNGSIVTLRADGAERQFVYSAPRSGLPVTSGTLLFKGKKSGDSYSGTAYAFSSRCRAIGYSVSGPVSGDQRSVTMYGKIPRRDGSCHVVRYDDDVLVFNFQDPNADVAAAPSTSRDNSSSEFTIGGGQPTVVCTIPVPVAIKNLGVLARSRPSIRSAAQADIDHLLASYCREIDAPPTPDGEGVVELNEYCNQASGRLNGERVYWAYCLAYGQGE
jgi:hypothetical protein